MRQNSSQGRLKVNEEVYLHPSGGSDEGENCSYINGERGGVNSQNDQMQAAKFGDNLTRILLPNNQVTTAVLIRQQLLAAVTAYGTECWSNELLFFMI